MPEQIRVKRTGTTYVVTATFGLMNAATYPCQDWKNFLTRKGWIRVPRVWD